MNEKQRRVIVQMKQNTVIHSQTKINIIIIIEKYVMYACQAGINPKLV